MIADFAWAPKLAPNSKENSLHLKILTCPLMVNDGRLALTSKTELVLLLLLLVVRLMTLPFTRHTLMSGHQVNMFG